MMGMYEEFNVLDDFKLSGMPILDYSNAFVINAENDKFSDLESMIAYMKDHPGEVSFNIVDAGTAAQKTTELLGKRLDVIGTQAGLVRDYLTTGQFTCLGILADEAMSLDDVKLPTLKEQGYDVVFSKFFYLAAPNDVDDEVITTMNEALLKAVENETFKNYCASALINTTSMTPEETESYYQEQYDLYAEYLADYIE